jgi:hypothetical protein
MAGNIGHARLQQSGSSRSERCAKHTGMDYVNKPSSRCHPETIRVSKTPLPAGIFWTGVMKQTDQDCSAVGSSGQSYTDRT